MVVAARTRDGETTALGPLRVVDRQSYRIRFGADGSVWLGSMARSDGSRLDAIVLPPYPDPDVQTQALVSLAPDGTALVTLYDQPPERSTGLLAIRPDAFADE